MTVEHLGAIVDSPNSHLFVAEVDGVVAGMLTLSHYLAPTGLKMWIEDVVVDGAMRGRSLGRRLVEKAVGYSRSLGTGTLMLTSRPSREAANTLYRSCGFTFKETNNYVMKIVEEKIEQD
ncbi:MAG: GNAT family N-acetyltransferase [Bacteroidaceae bacterium]|nr:GNAT family N-acetyltransferase [Bacteroidaceae bacterium]